MKITLHMWVEDAGDGSPYVQFFRTREEAEAEAEKCDQRYCDDVISHTIEIDSKGNIIKP